MNQLIQNIHATNDYERSMFLAHRVHVNGHLDRWISDVRPEQMNNNFFFPTAPILMDDIEHAIDLQKERGLHYLMLRMTEPMDTYLTEAFAFDEEITFIMALRHDSSNTWSENVNVEIRDIQSSDISADLLDVSSVPQQYQKQAFQNMQMVLDVAKTHPEYHWLCAYHNGVRAGSVYALCYAGCVEVDDLWVEESFRNQYIATTLMKYIATHFNGTIYLHADAAATPKNMYTRMGFETVETIYDYYLEWE